MLPFAVCLSFLLLAFGAGVWLLLRDRKYWRDQYQALAQEAREREKGLFDQLLLVKGFRTTAEPVTPPPAITRKPALDADDLEIIDSRINERVEAGVMTPTEGWMLAEQARNGAKTTKDIDAILWKRQLEQQRQDYPGSIADID